MTTTTRTRNRYFIFYPRNFANEYTVYEVATPDVAEFRDLYPDAEPIGAEEARRRGINRPRQARRSGEQWFAEYLDPESTRREMDLVVAMRNDTH